ncbi:MAG TPA: hypothetical protein VHF51_02585 [Solirubrobacteraceae bacterium]|nr:hypothetical protein [Solirubrobacteraceae bacterium]
MSAGLHALPGAARTRRAAVGSRAGRAGLAVAVAAAGVAASALAFGALWPADPAPREPARLGPADAAAARAVVIRARTLVSVTPEQLGYRLHVAGPLPGVRGRTDTGARTITLFVSPHDAPHRVAHDLGHEIGHAFDASRLSGAERAAYLRARGVPGASWWPGREASDYRTGAGDFAEVFALCRAASPDYRSRLAARPQDPCAPLPKRARAANLGSGGS